MCIGRFIVNRCAEVRGMNGDNDVKEVDRSSGNIKCLLNSRVEIVDEIDETRQFYLKNVSNSYTIINKSSEKR